MINHLNTGNVSPYHQRLLEGLALELGIRATYQSTGELLWACDGTVYYPAFMTDTIITVYCIRKPALKVDLSDPQSFEQIKHYVEP